LFVFARFVFKKALESPFFADTNRQNKHQKGLKSWKIVPMNPK